MVKWRPFLAAAALAACAHQDLLSATPSLEVAWRIGGLASPESAALSADRRALFVTNVNGDPEAKDGNGFVSRIGTDGTMLEREFAVGLDAPKGIALSGDSLYVADIDQIVVLDAQSGAIRRRLAAPGARFLNDIAVLSDGTVLAADSAAQRIYAARGDTVEIWLEHELLQSVNGLLPERGRLVVTTMQGRLLAIDYASRDIAILAEGLGDADGVAALSGGRYLVSEWPGLMHVVARDGTHQTIMDTRAETRLLNDFMVVGDMLYQPHWAPGELTAYRIAHRAP